MVKGLKWAARFLPSVLRTLTFVLALAVPSMLAAQVASGSDIRRQIQQSGLTPEQIRQRLVAAGYSASLLDQYLNADTTQAAPMPSADVVRALSDLRAAGVRPSGVAELKADTGTVTTRVADAPDDALQRRTLRIFGADVFRGRTTQFQPLLSGPVPESYRVGAGDVLVLVLTGDVELVHTLEVTRDGFVVIPQVGQVFVSGVAMPSLRQLFRQRLGQSYSGIRTGSTQFDVTIGRLRTNQVFVIGEVAQPGAYQLASVATVLNALYAAGGITDRGTFRDVVVRRQGREVVRFDLYDYLLRGDTRADVTLEMGDVVFVGVHGVRASIEGGVIRPAIYEVRESETLRDLVGAAGGFDAEASLQRVSIARVLPAAARRPDEPQRVVVDVPLIGEAERDVPAFPLAAGDEVRVFSVPRDRAAVVELRGAVYQPGTYGWRRGLRLSEIVSLAGGFKPAVYPTIAHVDRLNAADSTRYLVRVPLPADSSTAWERDVELEEFDIVTVFGREALREVREVAIAGMVNKPGTVSFSDRMTVRDLILMAGGLKDGASLDSVEVARLPVDRSGGQLARILRFPLDSTYLFEPEGSSYRFLPGPQTRASGAPEIPLEPFDRVTIFRQPEFELQRQVEIRGELYSPGTFSLRRKDERLSDVVKRAGGLLPTAYAPGARLERAQFALGRVDIDLAAAIGRPGSAADLVLQPGDVLTVPEYNPVVRVEGAVVSPTSVQYREGRNLKYYIENAGGWTRTSDRTRVSVRAANGSAQSVRGFFLWRRYPEVGPGSVIVVGAQPEPEPLDITGVLAATAQILASTVAIIVVATR